MIHRYFYRNKTGIIFSINSGTKRYDQRLPRSFWRRRKTKIKEQFVSLKIFDPAFSKNGARPSPTRTRHTGQFVGGKVVKGSNESEDRFLARVNRCPLTDDGILPSRYSSCIEHTGRKILAINSREDWWSATLSYYPNYYNLLVSFGEK